MANTLELTVPDLGGFEDVPIIEILIATGDAIGKDAPLLTLESDKATMEVPASFAGTVRDIKVKIGDRVSQGTVIAHLELAAEAPSAAPARALVVEDDGSLTPVGGAAPAHVDSPAASITAAATHVTELIVPDLGGASEIPVIAVFVAAGQSIAVNAPLVELESDKATMEVPALAGGIVGDVCVKVGDKVSPGTVIATVSTASAGQSHRPPAAIAPAPQPSGQSIVASSESPGAQSIDAAVAPLAQPEPTIQAPVLAAVIAPAPPSMNGSAHAASNGSTEAAVHASPAIRRFARELGVNLRGLHGNGPNGRITRDDVQAYVKATIVRANAPAQSAASATAGSNGSGLHLMPWPKIDFSKYGAVERRPLSRIAKLSGQNLARNWVLIPHVTQNEEADVTELEAFRKAVNAEHKDVKVTMLALLMKALVTTLRAFPTFNSSLDGDDLVIKSYYHLGFAADTPNGLVVPVIKDVESKGVLALATETAGLAKRARDGKLGPGEMSGSTFTISSLGGIGGTSFTPIINAPEVAILGVSKTAMKPVWDGTAFAPRLMLPLSLSYDHRVIDGAAAARFCASLASVLGDMRKTLL